MSRPRGFTLLEVVVALAILGMSLLAIFDLNAGAVASHVYVKELTVATMLARSKITDLEQDLYDRGFQEDDDERSGDFGPEGWSRFQWRAQILAPRTQNTSPAQLLEAIFAIPADQGGGLAAAFGGAAGAGKPSSTPGLGSGALPPGATGPTGLDALGPFAALAQTQMTQMLDQIRKGVREVHLTVSWKSGKRVESFDLVTHLVSLRQGSDRNGTPGVPLSQGVPGLPGQPGLPGPVPGQPAFPGPVPRPTPLRAVPVQPTPPGSVGGTR